MRRSKSNPAKYARNYQKISQRRMTEEEQNINSMILDQSEEKKDVVQAHELEAILSSSPAERQPQLVDWNALLSPELQARQGEDASNDYNNMLILPPRTKKKQGVGNEKASKIVLDPCEIRQMQLMSKNQKRKLAQLERHKEQKIKRAELYHKLEQSKITQTELALLKSSSSRGAKESKMQTLRRLMQKERAGIALSADEHDFLYNITTQNNDLQHDPAITTTKKTKVTDSSSNHYNEEIYDRGESNGLEIVQLQTESPQALPLTAENIEETNFCGAVTIGRIETDKVESKPLTTDKVRKEQNVSSSTSATSLAKKLMENLHSLKKVTEATPAVTSKCIEKEGEDTEQQSSFSSDQEESSFQRVKYVPPTPVVLKTSATLRAEKESLPVLSDEPEVTLKDLNFKKGIVHVNRPLSVQESRLSLPVCEMEYEIIEAVKSNSVVILCAETGSGKSTQVPQFLYEAGFTGREDENDIYTYDMGKTFRNSSSLDGMIIGITQPRRVAAISTAKRVAFEMGCDITGNSTVNKDKARRGNLVAFQTRYETAGMGSDTRIKFMTDGVLLQEIQQDLLLRQYSTICLDELHERNLNGDVLLGLLSSATLPLRQKAAEEGSIPPLKLIIMSATLRVEDFNNNRLFPSLPAVVKIPGRNYPVTIHHSKATILDDYEMLAFEKVCKIHRNLPNGGILVFLTGKQEIMRMVQRLRKRFGSSHSVEINGRKRIYMESEVTELKYGGAEFREMDDEEIDGDLFQRDDDDDDDKTLDKESSYDDETARSSQDKPVYILPLYSMLSTGDQAKVFAPVPEGHRLIVVATNIAETSVTIPDIKYVVDTGRQKSKNYHASTGIVSYNIMWISQAAADQRAGRAGRCGAGHCYRLYSSSLYSRHLDKFSTPEILTLPLEDVVLQMKAMKINNIGSFPFPTAPSPSQLTAALKVLCEIGLVDRSNNDTSGGDGRITNLGKSVSQLPLNARFGKMLLVAAQANVLEYAVAMVAVLSEVSPFRNISDRSNSSECDNHSDNSAEPEEKSRAEQRNQWFHPHGDVLASLLAVGADSYARRGVGGASEAAASKRFCEENGLNFVVIQRIQKLRKQLTKLVKMRVHLTAGSFKTSRINYSLPPPSRLQENALSQAILSGLLDNVARLEPPGSCGGPFTSRAYFSCNPAITEPIYIDRSSFLFTLDFRKLPQFVCFGSLVRKQRKDGSTVSCMTNVTYVDQTWLGVLAEGSPLLSEGEPLTTPSPTYDKKEEAVICSVAATYGCRGWCILPVRRVMYDYLESFKGRSSFSSKKESFRWFARFLLEGKVIEELNDLPSLLNEPSVIITSRNAAAKVVVFVSALADAGIDNGPALRKHWAEIDQQFLFRELRAWVKKECFEEAKNLWMKAVKQNVQKWKNKLGHGDSK